MKEPIRIAPEKFESKSIIGFELLSRYETMMTKQLVRYQEELRALQSIRILKK